MTNYRIVATDGPPRVTFHVPRELLQEAAAALEADAGKPRCDALVARIMTVAGDVQGKAAAELRGIIPRVKKDPRAVLAEIVNLAQGGDNG
jgi:hypothetical protein